MKLTALIAPVLAGGLLLTPATAQDDYEAKYEKKLAKEFISYGSWVTDYDEARARAKKEGKMIFAYFSRSYSP